MMSVTKSYFNKTDIFLFPNFTDFEFDMYESVRVAKGIHFSHYKLSQSLPIVLRRKETMKPNFTFLRMYLTFI
jgi:hypothetical protein